MHVLIGLTSLQVPSLRSIKWGYSNLPEITRTWWWLDHILPLMCESIEPSEMIQCVDHVILVVIWSSYFAILLNNYINYRFENSIAHLYVI